MFDLEGSITGSEISDSETEESDNLIEQGLGFLNNMYPNGRIPIEFVRFQIGLGEGFGLKYVSVISYASEVFLHLRQFDRVDGKLKLTPLINIPHRKGCAQIDRFIRTNGRNH